MRVKEMYFGDRPREKLRDKGPESLTNEELIAILLGSGQKGRSVFSIAEKVEKVIREKKNPLAVSLSDFTSIQGIGMARGCVLTASLHLYKRFSSTSRRKRISDSEDVYQLLSEFTEKRQEHFISITLDGAHCVINTRTVFIGTLNQSIVHPREVFASAVEDRAAAVIIAHNHPSDVCRPSREDIDVTERLSDAGLLLGIPVLDHIILCHNKHYSFKSHNLI
ncbi:MAG: DNA repair protein RadC [bacterium]